VSIFGVGTSITVRAAKKENIIIGIDPGHQLHGNSETEAVGPGASTKKAKVSSGTSGVSTGVPEYKLNMDIARQVKKELKKRGYQVVMTRTKNNVNISNKERAQLLNESGADICIRLHADGVEDSSVAGASILYPSKSNKYVGKLSAKSLKLSKAVINSYCEATGIKNRGCVERDDLTGTNWSEIPVALLEMGFMSNPSEDKKMQRKKFQKKMVQGICDGIDAYYAGK
jgi:N-acetylmuramoyl-L-alanine amidase